MKKRYGGVLSSRITITETDRVEKFIINSHWVVRLLIVLWVLAALGFIIAGADMAEAGLRGAWDFGAFLWDFAGRLVDFWAS